MAAALKSEVQSERKIREKEMGVIQKRSQGYEFQIGNTIIL